MRYAISYVSSANPEISPNEIQDVLDYSRNWNNAHNITGILLYSEGNFFQVLEGEQDLLIKLFKNIMADKRHYDIMTIFKKEVLQSRFSEYSSQFVSLDSHFRAENLEIYFSQIEKLNPEIQSSVRYILKKFTEGIKSF